MDLRQSLGWANYLISIGWQAKFIDNRLILIRKIPFLGSSIIKIQRPQNPVPFDQINELAKKEKALFVLIEPEIKDFSESDFKSHGFSPSTMTLTHTSTIQIDLTQTEENLWKNFSENARRNIRKAQSHNLIIRTHHLKKDYTSKLLDLYFDLSRVLIKMKNFYLPGYIETEKKMTALKDLSILLFAYKPNDKAPIASIWLTGHQDRLSYLQTGITEEGYELMANYLLVWEGIKLGIQMGFKTFDFEGVFDPRFPKERKRWIGFSEFKKRFHGNLVEYPTPFMKIYNPIFKVLMFVGGLFY